MTSTSAVDAPLSHCGCCTGTHALTPARYDVLNPPGAPALRYRVGTQAAFFESMQAASSAAPAMRPLDVHRADDGVIAVMDAWACALDVLSFYTERIANEGFVRTASETLSLVELARTVGYERARGRASGTWLMFTLETATGSPAEVPIPKGTKVGSRPGPGEQPQTFETTADLVARPEWNTVEVATRVVVPIDASTTSIYLDGIAGDVRPGDPLLIVGKDDSAQKGTWALVTVRDVTPLHDLNVTHLSWDAGEVICCIPDADEGAGLALRQRAAFFGYNARLASPSQRGPSPLHAQGQFLIKAQILKQTTTGDA